MQIDLGVLIGLLGVLAGIVFGIFGWMRNRDTDKGGNIRQMTTLEVKLDMVISSITKFEVTASKTDDYIKGIDLRITSTESALRSLHKRLDEMLFDMQGISTRKEHGL